MTQPDFPSPIAGRIEVREPCPWCDGRPMVPRSLMDEHVAQMHPEVQTVEPTVSRADERCPSCEHQAQYHDADGRCWFTVEQGVPERDAVCSCQLRRMADETQPAEHAVTMHAVPLPGSNGISACCGRPPRKFIGERVTRDPDKVTCTGLTAAERQDGAQPAEADDIDEPTPAEAVAQALADIAAVWSSWTSGRLDTDDAMTAIRDHLTTAREQGALK